MGLKWEFVHAALVSVVGCEIYARQVLPKKADPVKFFDDPPAGILYRESTFTAGNGIGGDGADQEFLPWSVNMTNHASPEKGFHRAASPPPTPRNTITPPREASMQARKAGR
jgi:hypothetical protein